MCYSSEASGTSVYIDTSGAKATENIATNVCQCSVKLYKSKQLEINSTGDPSPCGSVLEFNRTDQNSIFTTKDCGSYSNISPLSWPEDEMTISLHKQSAPFLTNFCVKLNLGMCPF